MKGLRRSTACDQVSSSTFHQMKQLISNIINTQYHNVTVDIVPWSPSSALVSLYCICFLSLSIRVLTHPHQLLRTTRASTAALKRLSSEHCSEAAPPAATAAATIGSQLFGSDLTLAAGGALASQVLYVHARTKSF